MGWDPNTLVRQIDGVAGQNITIGVASVATTNAFAVGTQMIQVSAVGGNCHIKLGTTPTAVATDMLIKGTDTPLLLRVAAGEKLAAIQDGASTGTCNVVEVTH